MAFDLLKSSKPCPGQHVLSKIIHTKIISFAADAPDTPQIPLHVHLQLVFSFLNPIPAYLDVVSLLILFSFFVLASTSCILYIWVLPVVPCLYIHVFCHHRLFTCFSGWTILELGGEHFWQSNSFPRLFCPELFTRFFQAYASVGQSLLCCCVLILLLAFFLPLRMLNSVMVQSLQLRLPPALISLISSSLILSTLSSRRPLTHQLLDNLCREVVGSALQKTSGLVLLSCVVPPILVGLKSTMSTGVCRHEGSLRSFTPGFVPVVNEVVKGKAKLFLFKRKRRWNMWIVLEKQLSDTRN